MADMEKWHILFYFSGFINNKQIKIEFIAEDLSIKHFLLIKYRCGWSDLLMTCMFCFHLKPKQNGTNHLNYFSFII